MLSASINLPKPVGHAMVVSGDVSRDRPGQVLRGLGYEVDFRDDPYAAMIELCRRPLVFRAVVLSLQALYRDELQIIATIRRRFPHMTIWLTQTDGRQASLAEARRLGAEGLVADDGIVTFVDSPAPVAAVAPVTFRPAPTPEPIRSENVEPPRTTKRPAIAQTSTDPVLTADELQALLGNE
jgi:CheY-like chemotaxis protein